MRRGSVGLLTFAVVALLWSPARAADSYLRGSQLADLYGKYAFCYNHATEGYYETCSAIEEIVAVTPTVVRITHRELIRFREQAPNSWGEVLDDVLLTGTILHPEGWERTEVQTQTVIANGLCRDKQTRIQDHYQISGVMVADLSKPWTGHAAVSTENLTRWRDENIQSEQSSIANVECSRYTVFQTENVLFGSPRYLIGEDLYFDEMLQPGRGGAIKLFPKGTSLILRPR